MEKRDSPVIIHPLIPVVLLLLFYYVHYLQEFYPFLSAMDPVWPMFLYLLLGLALYGLLWRLFKQKNKAGLATVSVLTILLFFGAIKLALHQLPFVSFLGQLRFLFPATAAAVLLLVYRLYKSAKNYDRTISFLTLSLTMVLLYEGWLVWHKSNNPFSGRVKLNNAGLINEVKCDTCVKPDIYILVVDELASSRSLKTQFGEHYSYLDSALSTLGFQVIGNSRSNYNFSHFSLASSFNLEYLTIKDQTQIVYQDYSAVRNMLKENRLMHFLERFGYSIQAYSGFHIRNQNTFDVYFRLGVEEKDAMFAPTLLPILYNAVTWTFQTVAFDTTSSAEFVNRVLHYNEAAFSAVARIGKLSAGQPKLVYTHFLLPHYPYLMDSAGNRRSAIEVSLDTTDQAKLPAYLSYYKYSARRVAEMAKQLMLDTKGEAIIFLMGDHGFRSELAIEPQVAAFENYNAVYFPGNKIVYPDTVTLVNQFRILLAKQFNQPILPLYDSVYFLQDKNDPFLKP